MTNTINAARRRFLQISLTASGALLVGWRSADAVAPMQSSELLGDDVTALTDFVMIERDNRVVIGARGCEVGQGVLTSLPMLIAEELGVNWSQVRVVQLPYGYTASGNRYGSQDPREPMANTWIYLRQAGAQARALMLRAAAAEWRVDVEQLRSEAGQVLAPDGRKLSYGALARSAAALPASTAEARLKDDIDFNIIGHDIPVADGNELVTGQARYGSDAYLAGVQIAVLKRCPLPGGSLQSLDDSEARKSRGVRDVISLAVSDGLRAATVAVLADDTWSALQAHALLKPIWQADPAAAKNESSAALTAQAHALLDAGNDGVVLRSDGDLAGSRKRARHSLSARYEIPFLAHAVMETPGALIELRSDGALLIASLQNPDEASALIHTMTGIARENIEIRLPRSGGSFGRRLHNDYVVEAVSLAQRAGKPVKLMWTREDDLRHDFYQPFSVHALFATLDRANRVAGWRHDCAMTPRSPANDKAAPAWRGSVDADQFPAGLVDHLESHFFPLSCSLPRVPYDAPAHPLEAFAVQSFIDEIAWETRRDAVELRLEMLGAARLLDAPGGGPAFDTGRMAAVLQACAERIQWSRKRSGGHALGIACHFSAGAYVAHAFEVSVEQEKLRIHRAVCVADVGRVINPLDFNAQVRAATVDGISTALHLAITLKGGQVQQRNFKDYPLLRMGDAPTGVEVQLITSAGDLFARREMIAASVAPALANAVFAASTVRVRKLPIMPELLRLL